MAHLTEMSPLKQESFKAEANTPGASDDPQAFLLANCRSLGLANPGNSGPDAMDFDMEWAYCTSLMDEETKKPEGEQLAAAQRGKLEQEAIGEKRKLGGGDAAGDAAGDAKRAKGKATWRKYGQKTLKGKEYVGMRVLRCYYRCNFPGCTVKKQVETSAWSNEQPNVTIHGIHNHAVDEQPHRTETVSDNPTSGGDGLGQVQYMAEPKPTPPLDQNFADLVIRANPHFVVADPHQEDCPIIFASDGFCKLTGYSLEETIGRNCRFLQGKDTNPNAVRQLTKAIRANQEIHIILLNYKKDRTPFWNLLHISPIMVDGKLHSIVGAQLDVSVLFNDAPTPMMIRDMMNNLPQPSDMSNTITSC